MDVIDWRASPPPIVVARDRATRRYGSPTLIGFIGTALIHAMIVPTVYLGVHGAKAELPEIQDAGAPSKSKGNPIERLVLITLLTTASSDQGMVAAATPQFSLSKKSMSFTAELVPPTLPEMDILTLDEDQPSQTAVGNGPDSAEQARLFGIYSGQIRARIERLWRRPRTPINDSASAEQRTATAETFQCQVQIVQDETGRVQEVLLPECNGSAAWQRSLVVAIQQASPLPAPPSVRVFSRSIAMNFVGVPYDGNSVAEDYEIEVPQSSQVNAQRPPADLFDEFRSEAKLSDRGSASNNLRSRN